MEISDKLQALIALLSGRESVTPIRGRVNLTASENVLKRKFLLMPKTETCHSDRSLSIY